MTNSLSVAFTCLCSFLTSHTYLGLKDRIGAAGLFWLYAALSACGLVFIALTVPETKGRTEAQIREFFLSRKEREELKRKRREAANRGEEGSGRGEEEAAPLRGEAAT